MAPLVIPSPRSARSTASVPFLPGYGAHLIKDKHHKTQSLGYGPGGAMFNGQKKASTFTTAGGSVMSTAPPLRNVPTLDMSALRILQDPLHRYNMTARSDTHDERSAMKESARNTYQPAVPPAWLKHDRQVLRFYAFFQEPVHESPKENFRIRNCVIQFYLEDGTMFITEPKVENSGIPQGTFVKRHRIPKTGGGFYGFQDLRLGTTIIVYSRAFRITDCDDFTRHFCTHTLQDDVGPNEETPLDPFRVNKLEEKARRSAPTTEDIKEGKEYNELSLGANRRNVKLQQYLENDRKVLCFKCLWDDPTRYGSRMYYTLHYYLADDTVELNENLARNSGRDPYPVFWRRAPLRRNPHVSPAPGMLEPEAELYKPEDFIVGQTVQVYGREILLYECDEFTSDFYLKYIDHEQDSLAIQELEPIHVQLTHPPHTGFGAEDDSLANCLHLTPRPPRKDIQKLMNDAEKVMRFEGMLGTDRQEDDNRRFVIGIYIADGSVGVWEKKQRNSGHTEGKFASKAKRKNPATGTWFVPTDFYVGAVIEINGTPFSLVHADEGTFKYMEANCAEFPLASISEIISQLLPGLQKDLAAAGDQPLSLDWLRAVASSKLGLELEPHELCTVQRKFGSRDQPDIFFPNRMLAGKR